MDNQQDIKITSKNLSKSYHSGELEFVRKQNIAKGDKNWRILKFQRIINPEILPYNISNFKFILPETFEKCIKFLVKEFKIIPLDKLLSDLDNNIEITDKTLALTFDGAWVDIFINAVPILKKYNVPATFFIPTSYVGTNDLFWEDKVYIILKALMDKKLPLPPFDFLSPDIKETIAQKSPDFLVKQETIFLYILGISLLNLTDKLTALKILSKIFDSLNLTYPDSPTFMTLEELKVIDQLGFSFGSQGNISHLLNDFDPQTTKNDIELSIRLLKNNLNNSHNFISLLTAMPSETIKKACVENNIKYILCADSVNNEVYKIDEKPVVTLRRNTIYQGNASQNDRLFCSIWDIQIND